MRNGYDNRHLSELCAGISGKQKDEPPIVLSPQDHLSRRTLEDIATLNENLRKICVD